jgi:DNA-binding response OmpR family regulator
MRLLLVEDEPDLGQAIQQTLVQHRYVVDWFQNGQTAWDNLTPTHSYDLAILDWMVPGMSGLAICQGLRSQHNPLPVILLTARESMDDRVTGLDAGADDYLVKPFGMQELLARLRALLRRPGQLQTPQLEIGGLQLDYNTYKISLQGKVPLDLTAKEFQLLEYFMQHPQQILTHDQIKARLWEWSDETISNVVAAQVRLLRRKLESIGYGDRIETVRGVGYRFNPHA